MTAQQLRLILRRPDGYEYVWPAPNGGGEVGLFVRQADGRMFTVDRGRDFDTGIVLAELAGVDDEGRVAETLWARVSSLPFPEFRTTRAPTIRRKPRDAVAIPIAWLRDPNLSLGAKGVLAAIESLASDGLDVSEHALLALGKDEDMGEIVGYLCELNDAGYITYRPRDEDRA